MSSSSFIALGDKDKSKNTIFSVYSGGLLTSRDSWCYNFSREKLSVNMQETISFYNDMVSSGSDSSALNPQKISWSRAIQKDFIKGV